MPAGLRWNWQAAMTLAEQLAGRTREGDLYEGLGEGRLQCFACGHACRLSSGASGICKVRVNRDGKLMVPWGYVNAAHLDPIEKKPFFHALPGTMALSFGMLGCDLHCAYCQNWLSSQALRDPKAEAGFDDIEAAELVRLAVARGASSLVSTYNEPLITAEWAVEIFRLARAAGLATGFVSNGHATPQVLSYLRPWMDLFKVDLKSLEDRRYRELGGRLVPVLDSLERILAEGFWLEVVTLVVPGFNDSTAELEATARRLAALSPDIPWHVTAFHKDYRMTQPQGTPPAKLVEAAAIGRSAGLRYVYAGNLPGRTGDLENTRCPACSALLVERSGFMVVANRLSGGSCPDCGTAVAGYWIKPRVEA
jgi:pyruvate formate lyase activating enzyme